MIKWKLKRLMFEYGITSKQLAEELNISQTAMCHLKNSEVLPEIGSNKICKIATCLSAISGDTIDPMDLMESVRDDSTN